MKSRGADVSPNQGALQQGEGDVQKLVRGEGETSAKNDQRDKPQTHP